jgi:electron transport complex protein RnfG
MKKNLTPTITLVVICVIVAALLGAVNMLCAPIVEKARQDAIAESLGAVIDGGEFEELPKPENAPESVKTIYREKNGGGFAVILSAKGYAGSISITCAIDTEGKVMRVVVTDEQETHGKGSLDSFLAGLVGLSPDKIADAEVLSGASITSTAIKNAITDAEIALGFADDRDSELLSLASELCGKNAREITNVELSGGIEKLYAVPGGGYVAYTHTSTQWVAYETEALIYIKDSKIVDMSIINWTVGGEPPQYPKEDYTDTYIGKGADELMDVEMVTGATGTSEHLRDAVADSFAAIAALEAKTASRAPLIVGIILTVAIIGSITTCIVITKRRRS